MYDEMDEDFNEDDEDDELVEDFDDDEGPGCSMCDRPGGGDCSDCVDCGAPDCQCTCTDCENCGGPVPSSNAHYNDCAKCGGPWSCCLDCNPSLVAKRARRE